METQLALSLGYGPPAMTARGGKMQNVQKSQAEFCLISTILGGAKTKGAFLQEWWSFHLLDSSYNYRRKMWAI